MKRRGFLIGGAAAALTTWPAWLARAFDPDSECDTSERIEGLFDGYRAARKAGKPLLVLIVPEHVEDMWKRGAVFGQVLNHGDAEVLAQLSLVTLACATRTELARLVALDDQADEPLFATVDTAQRPARARAYRVELPEAPNNRGRDGDWETLNALENAAIDAQILTLGNALRAAITELTAAPRQAAALYSTERIARAIVGGDEVAGSEVLSVATELYARAEASPEERTALIAGLAAAVKTEIVSRPLRGSLWASSFGCGTTIEGRADDEQMRMACGMGHVPEKSARFLYFFTKLPGEG